MPILGAGWEILVTRLRIDLRHGKTRTVGQYQVFHDGVPVPGLAGDCAESPGPGDNAKPGNKRRIEAGRYPLLTQAGTKYVTLGYTNSLGSTQLPRPGIELGKTGKRSEILIHPASGFLWSVGCINLAEALPAAASDIAFKDSRARVIAVIDDMRAFLGDRFPTRNGRGIEGAFCVIDGEP